jgi:hypothetical protein
VLAGEVLEGLVDLGQRVAGLDGHREGAVLQQPGQALQVLGGRSGADVGAARALAGGAGAGGDPAAVAAHGRIGVQLVRRPGGEVGQGVDPVGVALTEPEHLVPDGVAGDRRAGLLDHPGIVTAEDDRELVLDHALEDPPAMKASTG